MSGTTRNGLPDRAGAGLKPEHIATILSDRPDMGFFEVHAENYMGAGGPPHAQLTAICEHYPLSLHGVGLSIGAARPLDRQHLLRLKALNERYRPAMFSEHLAWSSHGEVFLNDLLPVPYTPETLQRICEHVDEVQSTLGRRMLLENPSTYVLFEERAPAAACCSTSTTSSSRLPTTPPRPRPISTPFRSISSAKSTLPAMPRPRTMPARCS